MKIGLIGLGIMGKPMAKNLLKAGYTDLLVSDLNQAAVDEVVAAGATAATQPEIGASCDVVLTMGANIFKQKKLLPILVLAGAFCTVRLWNVNIILIILVCGALGAANLAWSTRKKNQEGGKVQ